jgi:hypothetical protein
MSLHFFYPIDEANIFHYLSQEFKTGSSTFQVDFNISAAELAIM